ncbi:MAG: hypothetical protein J2P37_32755 [Ktedonobacteraceae bacterium]|nr:hypothetical protein [Ktedonobacteraceae bacterium]
MSKSEVARLRAQIEAEYVAGQQALSGIAAGTARHQVITARLERMRVVKDALAQQIGEREAMHVFCEVLEGGSLPSPSLSARSEYSHTDEETSGGDRWKERHEHGWT